VPSAARLSYFTACLSPCNFLLLATCLPCLSSSLLPSCSCLCSFLYKPASLACASLALIVVWRFTFFYSVNLLLCLLSPSMFVGGLCMEKEKERTVRGERKDMHASLHLHLNLLLCLSSNRLAILVERKEAFCFALFSRDMRTIPSALPSHAAHCVSSCLVAVLPAFSFICLSVISCLSSLLYLFYSCRRSIFTLYVLPFLMPRHALLPHNIKHGFFWLLFSPPSPSWKQPMKTVQRFSAQPLSSRQHRAPLLLLLTISFFCLPPFSQLLLSWGRFPVN